MKIGGIKSYNEATAKKFSRLYYGLLWYKTIQRVSIQTNLQNLVCPYLKLENRENNILVSAIVSQKYKPNSKGNGVKNIKKQIEEKNYNKNAQQHQVEI